MGGGSQIRHIFPPGGWQQGGLHLCVEAQAPPRSGSRGSCSTTSSRTPSSSQVAPRSDSCGSCSATSSRSPSSSQDSCGACSSSTCSTSSWTLCWSRPCSPRPAGSGGGPCVGSVNHPVWAVIQGCEGRTNPVTADEHVFRLPE